MTKQCCQCRKELSIDSFYYNVKRKSYASVCIGCSIKKKKNDRAKTKECPLYDKRNREKA